MTTKTSVPAAELRDWARGMYGLEAGTELLIRAFNGRFATPDQPWIQPRTHGYWIDAQAIVTHAGVHSSGERQVLLLCAALLDGTITVSLDDLANLDRANVELILAAIAHAAASHQSSSPVMIDNAIVGFRQHGSLYPWPEERDDQ